MYFSARVRSWSWTTEILVGGQNKGQKGQEGMSTMSMPSFFSIRHVVYLRTKWLDSDLGSDLDEGHLCSRRRQACQEACLGLDSEVLFFCADVVIGVFSTPIMAMSLGLTPLNAYFEAAFTIQYCVPI